MSSSWVALTLKCTQAEPYMEHLGAGPSLAILNLATEIAGVWGNGPEELHKKYPHDP